MKKYSIHSANEIAYKSIYKNEDASNSYEVRVKYKGILKLLPKIKEKSDILELGYGTGDLLHALSKKFPHSSVTGIELVNEAALLYKRRFPADKNVKLITKDLREKIPVTQKFDLIIASHVLEHLEDESYILEQVHNLLKVDGIFLLVVPDWGDFHNDLHFRQYTQNDIKKIAMTYGWKITREVGEGFFINRLIYYFFLIVTKGVSTRAARKKSQGSKRNLIFKNMYYKAFVNVLLFMNELDSKLFKYFFKKPMQWTVIYKKSNL